MVAMRLWVKRIKSSPSSTAAKAAQRGVRVSRRTSRYITGTINTPTRVPKNRQPKAVMPKMAMPSAIKFLPMGG